MFSLFEPTFIKPIQRIIEARRGHGREEDDTERLTTEASDKQAKYEARIAVARKEAGKTKHFATKVAKASENLLKVLVSVLT